VGMMRGCSGDGWRKECLQSPASVWLEVIWKGYGQEKSEARRHLYAQENRKSVGRLSACAVCNCVPLECVIVVGSGVPSPELVSN